MTLIVLPTKWFSTASKESISKLRLIINKSYDKVRYKYGIINSSRVKSTETFTSDFGIDHHNFVLFILISSPETFGSWDYRKRFAKESTGVQDIYDSDVPIEQLIGNANFELKIADKNFEIDNDIMTRTIATMGIKGCSPKNESQIELTAFTSFVKNMGTKLFNHVYSNYIEDSNSQIDEFLAIQRSKINKLRIQSVVIKEHDLVGFYCSKLKFKDSQQDQLLEIQDDGSVIGLEDAVFAHKPFHLSFLYRDKHMLKH